MSKEASVESVDATSLEAVIFDMDGALLDTEEVHRQAFNATFREFGLPWHWDVDLYAELLAVSGGRERLAHYCRHAAPQRMQTPEAADFVTRMYTRKTQVYEYRLDRGAVPLRPGVERLVQELLEAKVRMAIATATARAHVDVLLGTALADLPTDCFQVIGAGEQVSSKKPPPEIYRWVLDRLNLPGDSCLAIESTQIGLRAAAGWGIPAVATRSTWSAYDNFAGALAIIPDLACVDVAKLTHWHAESRPVPHAFAT